MTAVVLPPTKTVRLRLTWLLPAWFTAASALGTIWPGHGGQLFCIGALAGVWACYLADSAGDTANWLLPALVGGVPILGLLGWLLDRLEADPRLWLALTGMVSAGAGYLLLQQFPEVDRAVEHHGSLLAFGVCALQLGSYGATVALLAIGAGRTVRS